MTVDAHPWIYGWILINLPLLRPKVEPYVGSLNKVVLELI